MKSNQGYVGITEADWHARGLCDGGRGRGDARRCVEGSHVVHAIAHDSEWHSGTSLSPLSLFSLVASECVHNVGGRGLRGQGTV